MAEKKVPSTEEQITKQVKKTETTRFDRKAVCPHGARRQSEIYLALASLG